MERTPMTIFERDADVEVIFAFNGTRTRPIHEGYRPCHRITDTYLTTGLHHYYNTDVLPPTATVKGTITFISPETYPHTLRIGMKIPIQEGEKVVGCATVTKVFNPLLLAEEDGWMYRFCDTDAFGEETYDICGDDFRTLMNTCFSYCDVLSLVIFSPDTAYLDELEKYRIEKPTHFPAYGSLSTIVGSEFQPYVQYYRLCPQLKQLLFEMSDSIFQFVVRGKYKNPEDPAFYRKDGSVFLSSVIHEGEISLMPTKGEDVSSIVAKAHWEQIPGRSARS